MREACAPYLRVLGGRPLIVLTAPAREAVCILPDGEVQVRPLGGVASMYPEDWTKVTPAQSAALKRLRGAV